MFARFTDEARWWFLAMLAVFASVGVGVSFLTRGHSEWESVYRAATARLLAGESLYPPGTSFAYPPVSALLGVPVANASDRSARAAFYFANLLSIVVLFISAARLSHDSSSLVRDGRIFWLGMLVGVPFIFHTLAHQQTDLLVAALCLGGCYFLLRERPILASLGLGLAAAMKCTPLLFVPYLVLKGRPRVAIGVLLVAFLANLTPDLVNRPTDSPCHLTKWYEYFIAPMMKPDYTPGIWASEAIYNQSIVGAANRWFGSSIPASELKRATYGLFAGLAALGLFAMIRGRRHPNALAWECSLVLSAMLLLSPMSSVPHFVTMLLPGWLISRAVIEDRRWDLSPFLMLMILGSLASNKDLLGRSFYSLGLWYGSVMWLAVGAFLGSVVALASAHSPETRSEPRGSWLTGWILARRQSGTS